MMHAATEAAQQTILSGQGTDEVLIVATHDATIVEALIRTLPREASKELVAGIAKLLEFELYTSRPAITQFAIPLQLARYLAKHLFPKTAPWLDGTVGPRSMRCLVCEGKVVSSVLFDATEMTPSGKA